MWADITNDINGWLNLRVNENGNINWLMGKGTVWDSFAINKEI